MTQREQVAAVVKILKARFPNLTVEEVLSLAYDIVEALGG
jgi:hypothetical protein